jgi:hypothetical protein
MFIQMIALNVIRRDFSMIRNSQFEISISSSCKRKLRRSLKAVDTKLLSKAFARLIVGPMSFLKLIGTFSYDISYVSAPVSSKTLVDVNENSSSSVY